MLKPKIQLKSPQQKPTVVQSCVIIDKGPQTFPSIFWGTLGQHKHWKVAEFLRLLIGPEHLTLTLKAQLPFLFASLSPPKWSSPAITESWKKNVEHFWLETTPFGLKNKLGLAMLSNTVPFYHTTGCATALKRKPKNWRGSQLSISPIHGAHQMKTDTKKNIC